LQGLSAIHCRWAGMDGPHNLSRIGFGVWQTECLEFFWIPTIFLQKSRFCAQQKAGMRFA
jgi:hypothetical protein